MCRLLNNQLFSTLLLVLLTWGCKHDVNEVEPHYWGGYPEEIGNLLLTKCATAGCHNEKSHVAAAGINMESWERLMQGGKNNAALIPFSPTQSTLFLFTNTFTDIGPIALPTMPYGQPALSKRDVLLIQRWIENGAPSASGIVRFHDREERKKAYVLNGLCDAVSVIDLESKLLMRYIKLPPSNTTDFPEKVVVAPNGKQWYVLFASGKLLQYSTQTDQQTGAMLLGDGLWRSLVIASDGQTGYAAKWAGNSDFYGGALVTINLNSMKVIEQLDAPIDSLYFPYGLMLNEKNKALYTACYTGNFIYKVNLQESATKRLSKITLDPAISSLFNSPDYRPSNLLLFDDKYALVCERSAEVRIFDALNDSLMEVIPVGALPQEIVAAEKLPYLLVSCMEDEQAFNTGKGSVQLINTHSLTVDRIFNTGYQPKGMAIDQRRGLVYVANRNADPTGADAPHHYTDCEGNNGYVTLINLYALKMEADFKAEVAVDPYSVGIVP
jgi:DNA-binding beta-propeller fold protein YncE